MEPLPEALVVGIGVAVALAVEPDVLLPLVVLPLVELPEVPLVEPVLLLPPLIAMGNRTVWPGTTVTLQFAVKKSVIFWVPRR